LADDLNRQWRRQGRRSVKNLLLLGVIVGNADRNVDMTKS